MLSTFAQRFAHLADMWWAKVPLAILITLFGPWRQAYSSLLIVLALDLATGLVAAAKQRELSSRVGFRKSFSKLTFYAVLIILATQLEAAIAGTPYQFGSGLTVNAVLIHCIVSEAVSVVENLQRISGRELPIFGRLLGALDGLADKEP